MMRKLTSWFDAYKEFTEDTEPPAIFHRWAALTGLAIVLGRRVWLEDGNRKLYPNLYTVLVGPPGVGKGQAMRELRPFLHSVGVRFSPDKITAAQLVRSIAASTKIVESVGSVTPYLLWAEELPSFIGESAYESGMLSDLTALYDCPDVWSKETSTQGCYAIPGLYACLLAASTAQGLTDCIPTGTIGQGFISRLLFACSDYSTKRVEEKPWTAKQQKLQRALMEDVQAIAKLHGPMELSEVARVVWSDYYFNRPAPSDEFDDARLQGYSARKPMFVRKLAMLISAAESDSRTIEAQHLEQAIQLLDDLDISLIQVYNEITPSVVVAHYPRVIRVLKKATGMSMQHSDLMRRFSSSLDATQFRMVMDGLEQMKWIEREVVKSGQVNKYTVYYKLLPKKGRTM